MSYLCEECANKNCRHEDEPGEVVVQCGAFKKAATNADRVREMDDEELVNFAFDLTNGCPPKREWECMWGKGDGDIGCKECWLRWFQQSAEV